MTSRIKGIVCVACMWTGVLNAGAQAPASEGTVSGQGSVTIEKPADILRLQAEITAVGKDVKEALTKLKAREASLRKQFAELGTSEGAITMDDPKVGGGATDRAAQMQRMVMARMQQRGGAASKPSEGPKSVTVSAAVKVEWPLKASSPEELLIAATSLQEKAKAIDLSAKKDTDGMSEEEQEVAEESGAVFPDGGEGPKPGEPVFVFVRRISDEERAKAVADAFAKARTEATHLAKAAGMELGALRTLNSRDLSTIDRDNMGYEAMYMQQMYYGMAQRGLTPQPNEAIGMEPGKVTFRITVNAGFALK